MQFKIMRIRFTDAQLERCPQSIPFSTVEPFEDRAWKNHGQTLARLNERGGLDPYELVALVTNRPLFGKQAKLMSTDEAISTLLELLPTLERFTADPETLDADELERQLEICESMIDDADEPERQLEICESMIEKLKGGQS